MLITQQQPMTVGGHAAKQLLCCLLRAAVDLGSDTYLLRSVLLTAQNNTLICSWQCWRQKVQG
jgi:hypothetical protein